MSLLPQRKKSAEEIAKLREALGIGGPPPAGEGLPVEAPLTEPAPRPTIPEAVPQEIPKPAAVAIAAESIPATPPAPVPIDQTPDPKPVTSLRKSERVPVLPIEESGPPVGSVHAPAPLPVPAAPPPPAPPGPRQVRSLRKSEQGPLSAVRPPRPDSKLPIHRRSDQELNEIRRQEALSLIAPPAHPQSLTAHLAIVIPGYLFAIAGAVCYYFYQLEIQFTASCVAAAVIVAAFIYFKKPLSRHHAAFIGVMALFVIIFGALYYFPQLRHGT
jgi:hypothetical protein